METFLIDAELIRAIIPHVKDWKINLYVPFLQKAAEASAINTPRRLSAFLAQVAHESAELTYTVETADGSAYEGRADLGNTQPGDGARYRGRGLLQITGRANYATCGAALRLDLIGSPQTLERPEFAAESAGWYWRTRKLNELADTDAFGLITKRINGGYNGMDSRCRYWAKGLRYFAALATAAGQKPWLPGCA